MRTESKWQGQVGLICIVLLALLAPIARALDVCDQAFLIIDGEPDPVDIDCSTGYTIVSNSTVNLLPGAHISETVGGGVGTGILTVNYGADNIINIFGGQIDTMLNTGSTDTVTIYGSDFAVDGVLLDPSQDQIVNTGAGTYIFDLTGVYEDGSLIDLPCYLEADGVINLNIQQTAPEIEVLPALLEWDFGDVEVGQIAIVLVQIFNYGTADLNVSSVTIAGDADFTITDGPATPLVIAPNTSIGVDFEITYAPATEAPAAAVVTIVSDDEDESIIDVALSGVGIVIVVPPTQQIQDILDYFDASVIDGTLVGYGPGNSASKRLKALRNMIESASDLINASAYAQAIDQLESIAKKTDGVSKPQDFVVGGAAAVLNTMINDLIADLAS